MRTSPDHPTSILLPAFLLGAFVVGTDVTFDAGAQPATATPPMVIGSWRLLVTRDAGVAPVTYFFSAFADGTAIASQFSPGPDATNDDAHSHVFHGAWARDGATASFTVSGQETDANRAFFTLKFRGRVTFSADGNTLTGQWQGVATADDGRLIGTALRTVTGTRLRVEPIEN